ncbi:hypothetical protein HOQ56_gp11 [uncultured phage_MedDCM-OCT-S38-C3]|uniref:Uncharacterized protein n=1 Tax=uncultured phage_MedDCM-OCT-S38-C3 TaxID=2740803 RepID=A0A6S4PIU8_9CAUD|nr:hypothetical protein HOQ56_gp11 [uncultured phage_MedDCM-OCT-S38-C3]BAQ94436.1 hypothetical protein [uncultured phage_MedDCM-OCT-S38-C3]
MSNWHAAKEARYQENTAEAQRQFSIVEGPGITRADGRARTKLFKVRIHTDGYMAMTLSFHAESKSKALKYAQNRWPNARVEILL